MQRRTLETRIGDGGPIEPRFQVGSQAVQHLTFGPRAPLGGIMPGFDFADDLFPGLRVFADLLQVQGVERQSGGLRTAVVTGDASALIEQRLLRRDLRRCRLRGLPGGGPRVAPRRWLARSRPSSGECGFRL